MADQGFRPARPVYGVHELTVGGDPYPRYAWFRAHAPVYRGRPGWPFGHPQVMIFRHADVQQWLKDPRVIRQFNRLPEFPALRERHGWEPPAPDTFAHVSRRLMLMQDPPEHTRLRRLANRALTPRVAAGRRTDIEALVADLIDAFRVEQGGQGDLIEAFAYPLPMLVTARLLGIPHEDLHRFQAWSAVVGATVDAYTGSLETFQARVDAATAELCEYLRALVAQRRAHPTGDLMSRFISARDDDGGTLTDEEVVAMGVLMITAGHETMANVIANGTLALMRHRDQWDRLVHDPSLAASAAEELVRYDSPVQFTGRIAGADLEVGGVPVPRGSELLFMLASANRDETVWNEPDRLVIDRPPGRHLGFGTGIHYCLGAPLARLEVEVTFRALTREAPNLELLDAEPEWRPVLHGLKRLDVRLAP